ncbi:hypothetical protein HC031_17460 [Planosporangium thailandense]|uniref:DUF4328 domain-containing protein n=1 Tax=Planosporangium thailandense TaxID=765197 RepID=A0ABX0XZJ5_9ACTN|nr:hypothetical protein [Planosporangium thailandense]NJC71492.1 hypothetical protein [Planosporangium thailandense]
MTGEAAQPGGMTGEAAQPGGMTGEAAQPGGMTGGTSAVPPLVGLAAGRPGQVRPVSGLATTAMVAMATAALTDLLWAFTPLAAVWSVHEAADRGGQLPAAVLIASHGSVLALMAVTHATAWVFLAVWLLRTAANARVLGLARPSTGLQASAWLVPVFAASAVARASRCRRHRALVWSWWSAWLVGVAALVAGTVLTWPAELRGILARVFDGATVDVDRAGLLLGYQIAGRLPGAVLLLAAAALGAVAVDRVTRAQYQRFDELR